MVMNRKVGLLVLLASCGCLIVSPVSVTRPRTLESTIISWAVYQQLDSVLRCNSELNDMVGSSYNNLAPSSSFRECLLSARSVLELVSKSGADIGVDSWLADPSRSVKPPHKPLAEASSRDGDPEDYAQGNGRLERLKGLNPAEPFTKFEGPGTSPPDCTSARVVEDEA
ncbi:uncharacterized protein FOMMEDRAFT_160551 [Fomitiporia mediterranea MF3/22]|uniref:uncharacterized protein n=1 Tax=Fomitiporia mediterranea (strain MF3/22) TaxID=694068 RepID=UPI00044088D1|nr:uncharacterized protein FOMMEDRAFT_160551 [Fomitiporia mediterranea MF3/22]EJC99493.1 hypothetical protein FOMMEDRAFT_160551 [Fomitiporia mediterranea MF3/22]